MAKKRTNDGKEKPANTTTTAQKKKKQPKEAADQNKTPPGAQSTTTTTQTQTTEEVAPAPKKHKRGNTKDAPTEALSKDPSSEPQPQLANPRTSLKRETREKLPHLPDHVTLTKRPLHHPAPPPPFSNADHPKTIYLTATSPFIPALKRVRSLLAEIAKRHKQSLSAHNNPRSRQQKPRSNKPVEADGKLKAADLEREMADDAGEKRGLGAEEVFVKATGRAIERALQIGVHFQGESDCRVRVEMGSVQAIDDIAIKRRKGRDVDKDGDQDVDMDVEGSAESSGQKGKKGRKWKDEDIPETRIRTLSSITVAIGLE